LHRRAARGTLARHGSIPENPRLFAFPFLAASGLCESASYANPEAVAAIKAALGR
jgi:hypothetical protein